MSRRTPLEHARHGAYNTRPQSLTYCLAGGVNRSMQERDETKKSIAANHAKYNATIVRLTGTTTK